MPKCKNCKEKYEAKHFNQKYCFKSECVKIWVQTSKVQNWKKEKKIRSEELETVQQLMKKAQIYFNSFIRERDKDLGCISCKSPLVGKYDAGHYFSSGGHKNVTFNENNVHGQCVSCNQHKHGNLLNYQIGIEKRIGGEKLLELHEEAHKTRRYSRLELKFMISEFKKKNKLK
jgi:hypothetical protein